jgi:hypothetical protein
MKTVKISSNLLSLIALAVGFFTTLTVAATPLTNMVKIDTRLYSGTIIADANVVVFDVAYSNAVDLDDALKMPNSGENFGIQRGSSILVVEGRQPAVANDSVPFKMWNMRLQAYKLEIIASNLVTPGLVAVLQDAYLNTSTVLNSTGTTTVNFTVSSAAGSSASNRFRIIFREIAQGPLPVTFVSIAANRTAAAVNVAWKVAGERNVKNYEVQRSTDGNHFTTIATLAAQGNSSVDLNYTLSDAAAPATAVFYRINSVDQDGQNKFSSIVKVNAGSAKQGFVILSNPVREALINVQFKEQLVGRYSIRLVNGQGQTVLSSSVNHSAGSSNESLTLPATITNGMYWLMIVSPDNSSSTQTLVISK